MTYRCGADGRIGGEIQPDGPGRHVTRIFRRLGLIGADFRGDPLVVVPRSIREEVRSNAIEHGEAVCAQREQACDQCVLVSFCDVGRRRAAAARPDAPVAVDLFAGAGGMSRGFADEGFRVALAVEKDRNAAQTFRANHPGVPVAEADVSALDGAGVRALAAGADRVDVVVAGPPCQGYSRAGKRIATDKQNLLFREVGRIADQLDAQFVVIENVLGVQKVGGRAFVDSIIRSLRRRRYSAAAHEVNARDFRVPQRRRRYIFLARRSGRGPQPSPPTATVKEYEDNLLLKHLSDLPSLEPGTSAEYRLLDDGRRLLNGSTMAHSQKVVDKIRKIDPGKGPISYRRLHPDAANTIIAGHRALPVHPTADRTISVREAARIQGFDDDYVFCGPRSTQPLQVANAVPPAVSAAIARSILACLAGRAPS